MFKKIIAVIFLVLIFGCATSSKNFHSLYYFNGIETWTKDKFMVFFTRDWWDCTEFAYYGHEKLLEDYNARIVVGKVYFNNDKSCGHAWVEYLDNGKIKVFDMYAKNHVVHKYKRILSTLQIYNFIRTEQFLRSIGYEVYVKVGKLKTGGYLPYIIYKKPYWENWKIYGGEFDYLRPEKYKWINR